MEPVTINRLSQTENIPNDSLTLEQAEEKMDDLLLHADSNAWDIGDLINSVEKRGLPQTRGFDETKAWLETKVRRAQGKSSTLYKYAYVAAAYSKEQAQLWGMAILYELIIHDRKTEGHSVPADPADRDIQLFQEDGSKLVKKFRDCTYRDLQRSNMRRRKARKGPDQTQAKGSSVGQSPASIVRPAQVPIGSVKWSLAVLGLGVLLAGISEYLPIGTVSTWLFVFGTVLTLTSAGMLLRHWHVWRDRFFSAAKDGKAIDFLKDHVAKLGRQIQKVARSFHRWLMKTDHAPSAETTNAEGKGTPSEERTPPIEKKAA